MNPSAPLSTEEPEQTGYRRSDFAGSECRTPGGMPPDFDLEKPRFLRENEVPPHPWAWVNPFVRHPNMPRPEIHLRGCALRCRDRASLRDALEVDSVSNATEDMPLRTVLLEALVWKGLQFRIAHEEAVRWSATWLEGRLFTGRPFDSVALKAMADMLLLVECFQICGEVLFRHLGLPDRQSVWALMILARLERFSGGFESAERSAIHEWLLHPVSPTPPGFKPSPESALGNALRTARIELEGNILDAECRSRIALDDAFLAPLGDPFDILFRQLHGEEHVSRWILEAVLRTIPLSQDGRKALEATRDLPHHSASEPIFLQSLWKLVENTGHPKDRVAAAMIVELQQRVLWAKRFFYEAGMVLPPSPGTIQHVVWRNSPPATTSAGSPFAGTHLTSHRLRS